MADPKFPLKRVHFGLASPKAVLMFHIVPAKGIAVRATLDCDQKVVASWEWVELKGGQKPEEVLIPKGAYTLTLHVVFTTAVEATAKAEFTLNGKKKSAEVSGKDEDLGKILAEVIID